MPRPASLPSGNTGHAFWANLLVAHTFHATGNAGAAADDIVGSNDASMVAGAVRDDTNGLTLTSAGDYASLASPVTLTDGHSVIMRVDKDADDLQGMMCGDKDNTADFIWLNSAVSGVRIRKTGSGDINITANNRTLEHDYCCVFGANGSGGGSNLLVTLFRKLASDSVWTSLGTGTYADNSTLNIDAIGQGHTDSALSFLGTIELFMLLDVALTITDLDASFADPYDILVSGGGVTTAPPLRRRTTRFFKGR